MNEIKQKETLNNTTDDSFQDDKCVDVIKGYVWQKYDNSFNGYEVIKVIIRLPKKIRDIDTKERKTAWVNVYSYDWNNQKNSDEINKKIKSLEVNDLIAVKGKWRFYTSKKYPIMLSFNATDLKILKKAVIDEHEKKSVTKKTTETFSEDLFPENVIETENEEQNI